VGPEIKLSRKAIAFVRVVCVLSFIIWGVCFVISSGVYNRRFFFTQANTLKRGLCSVQVAQELLGFYKPTFIGFGPSARYKAHCIIKSLYSRKPTFVGLNLFVRVALQTVPECLKVSHECLKVSRTETNCCLPWTVKSVIYFNKLSFCCCCSLKNTSKYGDLHWTIPFKGRISSQFRENKGCLSRFKDRFWNIMLMMFYLNVFYLPILKQVVIQYKMWNQVTFWFTQMMCYNV